MAKPTSLVPKSILDELIKTTRYLIKDAYSSVHGVKKHLQKLSSKLTAVKAVLEDMENKQLLNNSQRKDWYGNLKEAALDAEDVLATIAAEAYHGKKQKHSAVRKIKGFSKRFDIIAEEKKKFQLENIQVSGSSSDTPIYTSFFVDKAEVVGRGADKEKITGMLLSNEFDKEGDVSVIPIIGMGGLGKTTLAQLVFNDGQVSAHFESRMWVCVTAKFYLERILEEMIQFHSKDMKLDDSSSGFLQSRVQEFLKGKRFLLVLDDVWTDDFSKWDSLRVLLKQGAKESRVLVTSRNTWVGDVVGTQPSYRLEYLPEDECWSLFAKIVFGNTLSSETRKELEDIGREIVRKCHGLPLAVKAMGGILRGHTDVSKWQQIQSNEIWEIEDKLKVMAALKLSYDDLPAYVRPCFEYCSLFPKSHKFRMDDLIKLWIAQGFIQSRGRDTMEEAGIAYFSELLIRSFFQPSRPYGVDDREVFLMHDLVHDLALSISWPECCQVKDNESGKLSPGKSRHVSLLVKDVEKPMLEIVNSAPKLRSLLLVLPISHLKICGQALDNVFRTLKYLRGLGLSSCPIEVVPDSIEELKLLRYLDLSETEIKVLPNSICNLFNLQTLKLLRCDWLSGLPKDLVNLVNLRHLELDGNFWLLKLSMLPPRMGNLTVLQNLPVFKVGRENGYGIEQLENMAHLSGTLRISKLENAVNAGDAKLNEKKNLHELVFEWSDRVVNTQDEAKIENSILEDLQPHSSLKKLKIRRFMGNEFPAWMKEGRLQHLVSLTLNGCIKCKTLALGGQLRELDIEGMRELEKWTEGEYDYLDRLEVSNCPQLRELPIVFRNLRALKIKSCNSLRALPLTPSLESLILIDNLILEDWNEIMLKPVEDVNDQGQPEIRLLGNFILKDSNEEIVQMEVVNDQGHPETRNVYPSFIKLLELKVKNCPKLQALPDFFFPKELKILTLEACHGGLVGTIPNTSSLESLSISSISNISSLPKWPQLPGLRELYISDCKDLVSLSSNGEEGSLRTLTSLQLLNEELPTSLERLSIVSCPLLKSIGPKEILTNLPSLSKLFIVACPILRSLPEDGLPRSLKHLYIRKCPLLTKRCQKDDGGGPDWLTIAHIPDLVIDDFHIVVPSTSVANRPYAVEVTSSTSLEEEMVKKAATDLNKAQSDRRNNIPLEHKRKKKWADEKTEHICFMLYAMSIHMCGGDHWDWKIVKETSDENIEVQKLLTLCWLEVSGKLSMLELMLEVVYEIVLLVKLANAASGWELPIQLTLSLPNRSFQECQVSLLEEPRRQWIELNVGNFQIKNGESEEVGFAFIQNEGHWKLGLLVKGAVFRPK